MNRIQETDHPKTARTIIQAITLRIITNYKLKFSDRLSGFLKKSTITVKYQ
ncbi:hypothetical protein H1P_1580008 [Hyella patelloides LEGE 07179]|uniref:Uncharacterized protein n=1 Tax=Hyella patelloides LEGE 07179 TaxID=945734 RepID=A0A563VMI2_9CYAN|nr:hypothetical protein H1P_1580008 [Hyella patelloides LEGE 07179]